MSREAYSFAAKDLSAFARALGRELAGVEGKPGHVQLLNMLTRSAGYRNFQHFRADAASRDRLAAAPVPAETVDHRRVERVTRHFDEAGLLKRWPSKAGERMLCLWVMWSRLTASSVQTEKQVNAQLDAQHLFEDYALLRRALCDEGLLWRTADGRQYRRIERRPPADARALIRHLALRTAR